MDIQTFITWAIEFFPPLVAKAARKLNNYKE